MLKKSLFAATKQTYGFRAKTERLSFSLSLSLLSSPSHSLLLILRACRALLPFAVTYAHDRDPRLTYAHDLDPRLTYAHDLDQRLTSDHNFDSRLTSDHDCD